MRASLLQKNDVAKTVGFYTLGCKMNYAETETLSRKMKDAGFQQVNFNGIADYYVVNSCSVTESANKKSRQAIRAAHRRNPQARIIVVGCYAQLKADEISDIEGVALVLGVKEKFNIVERIYEFEEKQTVLSCVSTISEVDSFSPSYSCSERTRAFLKVQDGCNYRCSYCTIPLARGKSRNTSIASLVRQAEEIAEGGVKEIVLSGINIGDFGQTTGETFVDLVKALDAVQALNAIEFRQLSQI